MAILKKKKSTSVSASIKVIKRKTKKQILNKLKRKRALISFKQNFKQLFKLFTKNKKFRAYLIISILPLLLITLFYILFNSNIALVIVPSFFGGRGLFFTSVLIFMLIHLITILHYQATQKNCNYINKKLIIGSIAFNLLVVLFFLAFSLNIFLFATLIVVTILSFNIKQLIKTSKCMPALIFNILMAIFCTYFLLVSYSIFMLN